MAYTSHGHQIAGTIAETPRPSKVARCGGPRMCAACAVEAAQAREEARKPKLEPDIWVVFTSEGTPREVRTDNGITPEEFVQEWATAFRNDIYFFATLTPLED